MCVHGENYYTLWKCERGKKDYERFYQLCCVFCLFFFLCFSYVITRYIIYIYITRATVYRPRRQTDEIVLVIFTFESDTSRRNSDTSYCHRRGVRTGSTAIRSDRIPVPAAPLTPFHTPPDSRSFRVIIYHYCYYFFFPVFVTPGRYHRHYRYRRHHHS